MPRAATLTTDHGLVRGIHQSGGQANDTKLEKFPASCRKKQSCDHLAPLPDDLLQLEDLLPFIFRHLVRPCAVAPRAQDLCRYASVCKLWRAAFCDDRYWRELFSTLWGDFGLLALDIDRGLIQDDWWSVETTYPRLEIRHLRDGAVA